MNKTSFILGVLSLAIALVLYLLNLNIYQDIVGGVNVNIYASWFFALLGCLLVLVSFIKGRAAT